MKKIILLATVLLSLVGCTNKEPYSYQIWRKYCVNHIFNTDYFFELIDYGDYKVSQKDYVSYKRGDYYIIYI